MHNNRIFYFTLMAFMLALAGVVSVAGSEVASPASAHYKADQTTSQAKQPLKPLENLLNEDGTLDLRTGYSGSLDPKGWRMVSGAGEKPRFVKDVPDAPSVAGDERWDRRFGPAGLNDRAEAVAVLGTDLYAGGRFSAAGGVNANSIARWDATTGRWRIVGSGTTNGVDGQVNAIEVRGTDVFVGGSFHSAGGIEAHLIARWDSLTGQWHPLGSGLGGSDYAMQVYAIAANGDDVYVGGKFTTAGGVTANRVARWNIVAQQWYPLGGGIGASAEPAVYDIAVAANGMDVYVGGDFGSAGGVSVSNIARWDTTAQQWHPMGSGVSNPVVDEEPVSAIGVIGTDVYVGGDFTRVGDQYISNMARWDTIAGEWHPMEGGVAGVVRDMIVVGADLYVGGDFAAIGGLVAHKIARLDTTTQEWHPLGGGIAGREDPPYYQSIRSIAVVSNRVYAGGYFSVAGNIGASNVARWDSTDSRWSALSDGPNSNGASHLVQTVMVNGADVYIGGNFFAAGDVAASNIARWDSAANRWHPLGDGVTVETDHGDAQVFSIAVVGTDVYVGGWFTIAGDLPVGSIARWDSATQQWYEVGDGSVGVNGSVHTMVVVGTDLYVGGYFASVDGMSTNNLARWDTVAHQWHQFIDSGGYNGVNAGVSVIRSNGTDLYVGGTFTTAGGVNANHIARWDGTTNQWHPLGMGVTAAGYPGVKDIAFLGTDVFAGGYFTIAGGIDANSIARWDSVSGQWHPLGSGLGVRNGIPRVGGIRVVGSDVYVGGGFSTAGGEQANSIARWDSVEGSWFTLGSGVDNGVYALDSMGNSLYSVGYSREAGNKPSSHVAIYHLPCPMSFSDVQPSDYFHDAVNYLYCLGAVSGYEDGTFRPYSNTTRGQLTKIVALAEGWPLENPAQPHFSDVPTSHPFYTFVETAYVQGVIRGYADGTFRPGNDVTRGQLSKIAVLAEGWEVDCPVNGHFSDVPVTSPFYCFVETAYTHGVVAGYSDGTFRPGNSATRGQISKIVYNAVTQP